MKFLHLRQGTRGGYTIAYQRIESPDNINSVHLYKFAYARCSHKDNYCKRIGRDIAMGRFMADQAHYLTIPPQASMNYIVSEIIHELYKIAR